MNEITVRYKSWSDAMLESWAKGDVDAWVAQCSEDISYTSIHPFGEHESCYGRAALVENALEMFRNTSERRVLHNEVLCAEEGRAILNGWITWINSQGMKQACNFIYIVTLNQNNQCTSYQEWNVVGAKDMIEKEKIS